MKVLWSYLPLLFLAVLLSGCSSNGTNKKAEERGETGNNDAAQNESKKEEKVILFFGNSLTAGYGLEQDQAFPAVIQRKIDSLGWNYEVVNAGLSGETTASGKNRIGWVLDQQVDIFVLELGANDGLRGIDLDETRGNLQSIIDTVRTSNPQTEIILAGMQIPPNMGQDYTTEFKKIFPGVAEKKDVHLIPFLLKDVGGRPELNQDDGIHPTAEGQKIVAENVWEVLKGVIEEQRAKAS